MMDIQPTLKNASRKPYIYKVTSFETGQYYIGSQCSGKTIGVNYFTSSTNKKFKNGFKTYREEKYEIEIIKEFEDQKKCVRAENYIIRNHMLLKDSLCLNRFYCCSNGEKIFSMVGRSPWNKGLPSPKKGIHLSEETRKKMRESQKGHPGWNKDRHHSEETRKKLSAALKGSHLSEEAKQKLSSAKKGTHHPISEETRKKISIALKGSHLSEETKQKIGGSKKGSHLSEETKQKMSISNKRRIKISIGDLSFDSITEASKYYNVAIPTIRRWTKNKKHNAVYIEK